MTTDAREMTGKQVWYPDKSLTMERTSLEQEEGGRGSFCRQPVTLTTRVCSEVRPKKVKKVNSVGAEKATETEPCPDSYPTVESCSGHRSILEYSTITNGYGMVANCNLSINNPILEHTNAYTCRSLNT